MSRPLLTLPGAPKTGGFSILNNPKIPEVDRKYRTRLGKTMRELAGKCPNPDAGDKLVRAADNLDHTVVSLGKQSGIELLAAYAQAKRAYEEVSGLAYVPAK